MYRFRNITIPQAKTLDDFFKAWGWSEDMAATALITIDQLVCCSECGSRDCCAERSVVFFGEFDPSNHLPINQLGDLLKEIYTPQQLHAFTYKDATFLILGPILQDVLVACNGMLCEPDDEDCERFQQAAFEHSQVDAVFWVPVLYPSPTDPRQLEKQGQLNLFNQTWARTTEKNSDCE